MHYKYLKIIIIVIAVVLLINYLLDKKSKAPDLGFQSLESVSDEFDSAIAPSQSLKNLLEQ